MFLIYISVDVGCWQMFLVFLMGATTHVKNSIHMQCEMNENKQFLKEQIH